MPASRRSVTCRRQRRERGPVPRAADAAASHQPDEGLDLHDRDDAEAAGTDPDETSASGDSASRDGAARLAVAVGGSRSSENGAVGRDAALIVEIRPLGNSGAASRRSSVSSRRLYGTHNSAVARDHDHHVDTAAATVANE